MDENTQARLDEKLKEVLALAKKKKNVLDYQQVVDSFAELSLEDDQLDKIVEYLEHNGVDVLRITDDDEPDEEMLLAEEEDERSQEMWEELFSIEQYVEMALQFSRLSAKSTDFVIGEVSLDKVVREAIHKYARMFVRKKIKLELTSIDTQVLTDEKWLEFVIEQILSNAIKYTAGGTISIYQKITVTDEKKEVKELIIEDTGIGIAPEDLPRIFEKGYTGYNGHADKRSTGIGLYLCRKIMRKLSHEITIESEIGVGTKVHLEMRSRDK